MPSADNSNDLPDYLTPNEVKYINKYREYIKTHEIKKADDKFLIELQAKLDAITKEQIDNVRKELLDYIEANKDKRKFSDKFIKELSSDNYLRGFIARDHKNLVEKIADAIEYLSQTDGLNDDTFPKEFLEFGVNFGTGFDLYGNPVFYLMAKRNFVPKKLFEKTEIYAAYIIYQLVRISMFTNGHFTMLLDFSGASVANVDFNALRLLITILNEYAPACLNRIICYNVHFLLKPAFKIGYALLPSNVGPMMHSSSNKEINKFISNEQLSTYIDGGLNSEIILGRPKKSGTSFFSISEKLNLPVEEAQKLVDQFRKSLKKNKLDLLAYEGENYC